MSEELQQKKQSGRKSLRVKAEQRGFEALPFKS